jgi:hypothetical protein
MGFTSTVQYFYKEFAQAPTNSFINTFSKKYAIKYFYHFLCKKFLSKYSDLVNVNSKYKTGAFFTNVHDINKLGLKIFFFFTFYIFL